MPIPEWTATGILPPGLHAAPLAEIAARCGAGSAARERQARLLQQIVEAALHYPTIKRILVWGSFVTSKPEPNDLDYSLVVSKSFDLERIAEPHRRFFTPVEARQFYGADKTYLHIHDYPLEKYIELVDFLCLIRGRPADRCGILEISLRGEIGEEHEN